MLSNRLFCMMILMALVVVTACTPQVAITPTAESVGDLALPFARTACGEGVDLAGQTIPFYHILNPYDQVDTVYNPLRAGYADAAEYFNAHGGICGATIEQVFDETHWDTGDIASIYSLFAALQPKPVVVTLYGSGPGEQLAPQLAKDEIPALNLRGGSVESAYGEDGKTPGWVFAANPLYVDQVGAMCDFIVANPDRFQNPVLGFMNFEDAWAQSASEGSLAYCQSLGIGYGGTTTFSGDATNLEPVIQKLVDAGVNIIYTNSHENGPAVIARNLFEMGLHDTITLTTVNRAMDPYVAFSGEADVDADGVPIISGMLGSLPVRSWAETDHAGIQLINEQADLHKRPLTMRTDGYIMGWNTTDLLIETYIQTGNRIGFDHINGVEFKKTLENIVYAPLGGVEQIDFKDGTLRALAENRIGEMNYLGQDGKTKAGPSNPPLVVTENGQQHLVPMILPLSDYQPAPDLRPGGADSPAAIADVPANTTVLLGSVEGAIAFRSDRDGNNEIYVMNGDSSGLLRLTENSYEDDLPAWSPNGSRIAFCSERDGNYDIYVMNADGSDQTRLTDTPGEDCAPAWSPDGTQISFISNRDDNPEIYVMSTDGSNQTRLTEDPAFDVFPNWSPDGRQIVFVSNREGQANVYIMNADGTGINRLTSMGAEWVFFPHWSPDGEKIAFDAVTDGNNELYVMNADGSGLNRLTNNLVFDGEVSWSPDATQILFSSNRDGNYEIYFMNADGSGQMRLTDSLAGEEFPIWQP